MDMLVVYNSGPDITGTNYFEHEYASRGVFYLTINAGAFRLLIPPSQAPAIADMKSAREVIISRGPWPAQKRKDAIELLFDDHTDSPYVIHMGTEQIDRLPPAMTPKSWDFSAWVKGPKCVYRAKCYYRLVPQLPYLKPLAP